MKRKQIAENERFSNIDALLESDRVMREAQEKLNVNSTYPRYKDRYDIPYQKDQIYLNGGHSTELETSNPGLITDEMKVLAEVNPGTLISLEIIKKYVDSLTSAKRPSESLTILLIIIAEYRLMPMIIKQQYEAYKSADANTRSGYTRVLLWVDKTLQSLSSIIDYLAKQIKDSGNPNLAYQLDLLVQARVKIDAKIKGEVKKFGIQQKRQ